MYDLPIANMSAKDFFLFIHITMGGWHRLFMNVFKFILLFIPITMGVWHHHFNSPAPGRSECDFKNLIFNLVLLIVIFRCSHDNALRWMPQDLTDDKSTLVQVMVWCCQATSHYLSQCWVSSLSPYGVAKPQWVNCKCLQIHSATHS